MRYVRLLMCTLNSREAFGCTRVNGLLVFLRASASRAHCLMTSARRLTTSPHTLLLMALSRSAGGMKRVSIGFGLSTKRRIIASSDRPKIGLLGRLTISDFTEPSVERRFTTEASATFI